MSSVVGANHVIVDPEVVASYVTDWTGRFRGHSELVVRPSCTEEVSAVVELCARDGIGVTLQGGNTGLVGGGVPLDGECVVSLKRLDRIWDLDDASGQLSAGAGATIASVQAAASATGWAYGVDLGSRDSATVGGTISTNAGGLRMLRYGNTRAQVLGIEAVLGDGSVISHLGGLLKDNTGYDLAGLLCGSEGTLGVVTAARLRLVPPYPERTTALVAMDDMPSALEAVALLRRRLRSLEAVEFFLDEGLELVRSRFALPAPFRSSYALYLLVEAAGTSDPTEELSRAVGSLGGVADLAVATEPDRRALLWRYREGHTEAINSLGPPHKLDVTLPARSLATFADQVRTRLADLAPGAAVWLFGHLGDGNVHVNVTGVAPEDDVVDGAVFALAAGMGGSISAEHGIGVAKKRWLSLNRSEAEIEAFRSVKRALDPQGILNPSVLL